MIKASRVGEKRKTKQRVLKTIDASVQARSGRGDISGSTVVIATVGRHWLMHSNGCYDNGHCLATVSRKPLLPRNQRTAYSIRTEPTHLYRKRFGRKREKSKQLANKLRQGGTMEFVSGEALEDL